LWKNLKNFDEETVKAEPGDCLRSPEIKGLMKRRDSAIQGLIDQRGEDSVLLEFEPVTKLAANR